MLIDKGVSAGEVITMKLTTGEEIVAKLIEENSHGYKVSKPLVLSMNQQGLGMIPFTFTGNPDKDYVILYSAVVSVTTTVKEFASQYTQGTTGIALG